MGVNAQTSVPLYAASEVLTAANMNISAGTGVPVFATTVTRDAAFGGANEKVLAEGQLAYIEASDVVQYYTGAAWASVSGLNFIASVTPAGAASITFTNCFSATYNSYLMVGNAWTSAGAGADCYLTISGSTGSTYNWGGFYTNYSATTLNGYKAAATNLGFNMGLASTVTNGFTTWIRNPFAAAETTFSSQFAAAGSTAATGYTMISNGYDSNTASSVSCTISLSGGTTFTGGTIKIYGLANA